MKNKSLIVKHDNEIRELIRKTSSLASKTERNRDVMEYLRFEGRDLLEDQQDGQEFFRTASLLPVQQAYLLEAVSHSEEYLRNERIHESGKSNDIRSVYDRHFRDIPALHGTDYRDFHTVWKFSLQISLVHGDEFSLNSNMASFTELLRKAADSDASAMKLLSSFLSKPQMLLNSVSRMLVSPDTDIRKKGALSAVREAALKLLRYRSNNLRIDGVDALCAFEANQKPNDFLLENCKVYYDFTSYLKAERSKTAVVVAPSYFFIRKWFLDPDLKQIPVIFILACDDSASAIPILEMRGLSNIRFVPVHQLDDCIWDESRDIRYVLVFSRRLQRQTDQRMNTEDVIRVLLKEHCSIPFFMNFGPDHAVTSRILSLPGVNIRRIVLVPDGIPDETAPVHKSEYTLSINWKDEEEADSSAGAELIHYRLINGSVPVLKRQTAYELETEDLSPASMNFRSLYYQRVRKDEIKDVLSKRRNESEYVFSDDISFFYTTAEEPGNSDTCRLHVYAKDPETGRMIPGTVKEKRRLPKDEVCTWLNRVYPYSVSLRKKKEPIDIRKEILSTAVHGPDWNTISLKTYLYIRPQLESVFGKELSEARQTADQLDSCTLKEITADSLMSAISSVAEAEGKPRLASRLRRGFYSLFQHAVEEGDLSVNPLRQSEDQAMEYDRAIYEVTGNLVSRHLSEEQNSCLLDTSIRSWRKGSSMSLAVVIKLLTGLETDAVCGLQWKDFSSVDGSDVTFHQLCIRRRLAKDGNGYEPLGKAERYRSIPCPDVLAEILSEELQKQLKDAGTDDAEKIAEHLIFQGKHSLNGITRAALPVEVNRHARKMLKKIISSSEIIVLPCNDHDTREIELYSYMGDIFRTNYRYYAWHCGFRMDDINYLTGNKTATTYAMNYLDYGNPAVQYILKRKQDRLSGFMQKKECEKAALLELKDTADPLPSFNNVRTEVSLVLPPGRKPESAEAESDRKCTITISNDHGFDLKAMVFNMGGRHHE